MPKNQAAGADPHLVPDVYRKIVLIRLCPQFRTNGMCSRCNDNIGGDHHVVGHGLVFGRDDAPLHLGRANLVGLVDRAVDRRRVDEVVAGGAAAAAAGLGGRGAEQKRRRKAGSGDDP